MTREDVELQGAAMAPLVTARKVTRPTEKDLIAAIGRALGRDLPCGSGRVSDTRVLDEIHVALTGHPASRAGNAYEKVRAVFDLLGLEYDPVWDSTEHAGNQGNRIVVRGYSRILAALTGTPRCFVLNSTDHDEGTYWETDKRSEYRYDKKVTGRRPLNDAGPGSRVLLYNTSSASTHPMCFVAQAVVDRIDPNREADAWVARLRGYRELPTPVPASRVSIEGRNAQHAITEIDWDSFQAITAAGGGTADEDSLTVGGPEDVDVAQLLGDHLDLQPVRSDPVPQSLPGGDLDPSEERPTSYDVSDDVLVGGTGGRRSPTDRRRDRMAEETAVRIVRERLEGDGWVLARDMQAAGAGYDLEFQRGEEALHVEVKGIQGPCLEFNLTAKEWWRVLHDDDFLLAAVTSALSRPCIRFLTRDRVATAHRRATQYRVRLVD